MIGRWRLGMPAAGLLLAAGALFAGLSVFGTHGPEASHASPVPLSRADRFAGVPIGVLAPRRAARLARLAGRQQQAARLDAETRALGRFVERGHPIYCGGDRGHAIALTFDDGPSPRSELIVALLRKARMQATFFLVGRQVGAFPAGARAIAAGNAVGDHTWSHPALPALHAAALRSEVVSTQVALRQLSGLPVLLFRPPYGLRSPRIDREIRRHGMVEVLWTIDDRDFTALPAAAVARRVLSRVRPGAIVLMHETRPQALSALRRILSGLRARGLESVTVPTLLEHDPPSAARLGKGFGGCGVRP